MGWRKKINGRGEGVQGDRTTTGALCISSIADKAISHGQGVLRRGDKTTPCPRCGQEGTIVEGDDSYNYHGQPVALDGALVHCGCPEGSNRLIAPLDSAASPPWATPEVPTPPPPAFAAPSRAQPAASSLTEEEEEEEEFTEITLRLGLFFDGTGNNQANSEAAAACFPIAAGLTEAVAEATRQRCAVMGYDGQGNTPDSSYGNDVTNVVRLYELYPDDSLVALPADADQAYIKVYLEGIGTTAGEPDSVLYGQGAGQGKTGVLARVKQVPGLAKDQIRALQDNNPSIKIRRIEVDLFGFSRGAAAARHCANDLLKGADSLLAQALPAGSSALAEGFAWRRGTDIALNFIGLFETVASVLTPFKGDLDPSRGRNLGLELRLAPGCARQVVHLVGRHEYRLNFPLTRTEHDIQLPGAHSDIGGGYLPLATERVFLSRPDNSLVRLATPDESTEAHHRTRQLLEREQPLWRPFAQHLGIDLWAVKQRHEINGLPPEKRVYAAIASERRVRGELSRVYLRIMRELGLRAGVQFKAIPQTPAYSLPAELEPIAAKLQAQALGEATAGLSEAEMALLCRDYIHLSANWNAAKGKHNSDLQAVFVNRPAEGRQRGVFANE
jgi:type VI secretion system secreted protein VgrG